jgi:hypothetical protein
MSILAYMLACNSLKMQAYLFDGSHDLLGGMDCGLEYDLCSFRRGGSWITENRGIGVFSVLGTDHDLMSRDEMASQGSVDRRAIVLDYALLKIP